MNFTMVHVFSPYTTILLQSWIHAMGVVLSMLHIKVKFPTEQGIVVMRGGQSVARQCLVATINYETSKKSKWIWTPYSNHIALRIPMGLTL